MAGDSGTAVITGGGVDAGGAVIPAASTVKPLATVMPSWSTASYTWKAYAPVLAFGSTLITALARVGECTVVEITVMPGGLSGRLASSTESIGMISARVTP
jgi:hypothetical protein